MNRPILTVDLKALTHNLHYFRSNLRPETKIMAMIKANAYGAGSIGVARALEKEHIAYLAVARTEEGITLRKAGILTPILVLLPDDDRYDDLATYHLEAEIYSVQQLAKIAANGSAIKIHLKLDTGMHRSGMESFDIPLIQKILAENNHLKVQSIFSHLASAEKMEHDSFTRKQAATFQKMYAALGIPVKKHILNSNGTLRFPQYHFDMVRLGIGLFGTGVKNAPLMNVNTLTARILQVRMVAPPETVGYNKKGLISKPSLIASINIGYGDGLKRQLGNGHYSFLVKGQKVKTVGVISMDITMIDVTDVPYVQVGDEVIIFGKDLLVDELATKIDTIPYEIFTSLSSRVERIYF